VQRWYRDGHISLLDTTRVNDSRRGTRGQLAGGAVEGQVVEFTNYGKRSVCPDGPEWVLDFVHDEAASGRKVPGAERDRCVHPRVFGAGGGYELCEPESDVGAGADCGRSWLTYWGRTIPYSASRPRGFGSQVLSVN
jgi:hypothetical protein